jgi:bis(5'-nucleosidyl)-tetraphosphatase
MPQEFSVGVILTNKDKFLLLRRFPGHWSFIKKNYTSTENKEEFAREMCKEQGIKNLFHVKNFAETEEYFFKKHGDTVHKEVTFFIFETSEEEITLASADYMGYAWLEFERAMARITFKPEKDLLKKALEHLKYNK